MIQGSNEEIKKKIEDKKNKRNKKVARNRWLKNLLWWLGGVFSGIIVFVGVIAIIAFALPVKDIARLAGIEEERLNEIVSPTLSDKSLPNLIKDIDQYKLSDIPAAENAINGIVDSSILKYVNSAAITEGSDEAKTGNYYYKKVVYRPVYDTNGNYVEGVTDNTTKYEKSDRYEIVNTAVAENSTEAKSGKYYFLDQSDWSYKKAFTTEGKYVAGVTDKSVLYVEGFKYTVKTPSGNFDKTKFYYKDYTFEKAFVDGTGMFVEGVDSTVSLYKLNDLFETKVVDAISAIPERMMTTDFIDLFDALGISNFADEESVIYDLLVGRSADDLSQININEEINNLKIYKLLGEYGKDSADVYNILCEALSKNNPEADYVSICLANLTDGSFDIGNVRLVTVIDKEESKDILEATLDAVNYGKPVSEHKTIDELRVRDLESIDTDGIQISTLVETPTALNGYKNKSLYNILLDAINDNPENPNEDKDAENLVIGDLRYFKVGYIKLGSVLALPSDNIANEKIYKMLSSALNNKAYADIIVNDFNGFDVNNIKLSSVIDITDNQNDKLYKIAKDVAGKTPDQIVLGDLIGFDTSLIRLSSVVTTQEASGNKILTKMLSMDTDLNPVTIGNLGATVNSLTLEDVYDFEHFIDYNPESSSTRYDRVESGGKVFYVQSETGAYQLSKQVGVWLIVMFDSEPDATALVGTDYSKTDFGFDARGNAKIYMQRETIKINELDENMESVYKQVDKLTIGQLIETGMITEDAVGQFEPIRHLTIKGMADLLAPLSNN